MSGLSNTAVTVIIPTLNEELNLEDCIRSVVGWAREVVVVDSGSDDKTIEIARSYGARCLTFIYQGGWPKKRQWTLDNLDFDTDWVLLLDADEIVTEALRYEIDRSINDTDKNGFYIPLSMHFLGKKLRWGGISLRKLSLFRLGCGQFERRSSRIERGAIDIEIHEHVVVRGSTGRMRHTLRHRNVNDIGRYIAKHNDYSNWEAEVLYGMNNEGAGEEALGAKFWKGNQAQRRRWMKSHLLNVPGSSLLLFMYRYLICLGFLDGKPGLIYCAFQAIQLFHVKAKLLELTLERNGPRAPTNAKPH